jgi:hypothetical protein
LGEENKDLDEQRICYWATVILRQIRMVGATENTVRSRLRAFSQKQELGDRAN